MLSSAQPHCLLIADISGYTSYLAGVELDHAQDILADLISTVVTALRPNFKLAKLEGDAAFVFAPAEKVDGSLLLDTIERCYFGFRRRRRDVRQATSCECNACVRIPDLNLKFVAHHGLAIRQKVAGREELLGSDVIVVHRLLKNSIVESTGAAAYAAFSQACVDAMGIDPTAIGMAHHAETYEHVGEVGVWVHDLERRWQEEESRRRVLVSSADALLSTSLEVTAPPQVVWEYLTAPGRRSKWQPGLTDFIQHSAEGGRRGVGTVNHCVHGKDAVIEEILDWRPYDYFSDRTTLPGGVASFVMTIELEPTATGTIVHARVAKPKSAKEREALAQLGPGLEGLLREAYGAMAQHASEGASSRAVEAAPEPPLPRPRPDGLFSEMPSLPAGG